MSKIILERLPKDDSELYYLVKALWGVTIPRHKVCPDHIAPFEAFASAYFNRAGSISLWHGSRGLSGKSFMLSILGITKAFLTGADVNLLGGSLAQSVNIHEHMRNAFNYENAPTYMIETEANTQIKLNNKARIRPLTASQKTVRGPHPPFLILDEIDEMDLDILDAALGQPMPQRNYLGEILQPYTVMCSTWQNSDGTFTEVKKRFEERGLPILTWCVAQDSLVTTARGEIPIQEVTNSDFVLTRNGFRQVQHVTFMGYKPTIGLNVGDKTLWATADHSVAIDGGWRHMGALAADTMSPTRANPSVLGCELVSLPAMSGAGLIPPSAGLVLAEGNQIEMLDVDASSVTTQMIDSVAIRDRTKNILPDPTMGLKDTVLSLRSFGSIAVALTSRPVDAVSGEHGNILLPVWDIGVEGDDHEFVANGVLVHNCYKDTANPIDGWLSQETIAAKKLEIPAEMWRVEYELGEPSIGNRAFDTQAVEDTFSLAMEPLSSSVKDRFEEYTFEQPINDGVYIASADWAKEQDFTVITVIRVDRQPHELVYYMRVNRRPYPMMINWFNEAIERYNAEAIHDATGLGNVVNDYIDVRARKFIMTGEKRANMLTEYVGAVERGYFKLPRILTAYTAHKYCRTGDLYSTANEFHLPDEVCSLALAWHMGKHHSGYGEAITVKKDGRPGVFEKHFVTPEDAHNDSVVAPMYEVEVKTKDMDDGINLMV